ncbi:hypothetical protein ACP4OV_029131 [Aristida adscensionis]
MSATKATTVSSPSSQGNDDKEQLQPTRSSQRAWTLAIWAGLFSSLAVSATLAATAGSFAGQLAAAFAALAAYSLADLATGVYHWAIDNYGDPGTPIFGAQIAAFQGHHRQPSSTVYRNLYDNLHAAARGTAIALPAADAALCAAGVPAAAHVFLGVLAVCLVLSQQFHAWAHQKRGWVPPGVRALQAAGVLLSPAQHSRHHRPPYNSDYCIISGMWNGVLERIRFFEALEQVIFHCTGVRPRLWGKPNTKVMQQAIDGATRAVMAEDEPRA